MTAEAAKAAHMSPEPLPFPSAQLAAGASAS
jgi:hypothetical protein